MALVKDIEGDEVQSEPMALLRQEEINEEKIDDDNTREFTLLTYLRHPNKFISRSDQKNSFKGFLKVLSSIPRSQGVRNLYKLGLFIFYFINFLYPLIVFIIEREHLVYNIVCSVISLVGVIYELSTGLFMYTYSRIKLYYEYRRLRRIRPDPQHISDQQDAGNAIINEFTENTNPKPGEALKEFIIDSFGELLIYPSIICNLYSFINEKGWQFDSTFAIFDFILLLYSVIMDAIYAKVLHIWHLLRVIQSSYREYDKLKINKDNNATMCRHFSPFSLTLPYAIVQVLVHWLMLAIIGIRIFVDNLTRRINDMVEIETGDYKTTVYTRYMIFCGAYLLIASTAVYLILNKYWFLEMYRFINRTEEHQPRHVHEQHQIPLSVKVLAFIRDPVAYILVVLQVVPFIPFAFGTFLPDYDDSEFEIGPALRNTAQILGWCLIAFFLFSNMQAVIICGSLAIIFGIAGIIVAIAVTIIAAIILGYLLICLFHCLTVISHDEGEKVDCDMFEEYTSCIGECCQSFHEYINADCITECAVENLDFCSCTCDPADA